MLYQSSHIFITFENNFIQFIVYRICFEPVGGINNRLIY